MEFVDYNGNPVYTNEFPIGTVLITVTNSNPSNFTAGTWVSFGTGKTIVGVDTTQDEFNSVEKTGGEKTHTLITAEMPKHMHKIWQNYKGNATGSNGEYSYTNSFGYANAVAYVSSATINTGGQPKDTSVDGNDQPHNNLQPYITVYMWKRTV